MPEESFFIYIIQYYVHYFMIDSVFLFNITKDIGVILRIFIYACMYIFEDSIVLKVNIDKKHMP